MTTTQARDSMIDSLELSTNEIRRIKNISKEADEARAQDSETYSKCPRCFCHHSIHGNFDNLCDGCQRTILEHFPNHPSVKHIIEALNKWTKQ